MIKVKNVTKKFIKTNKKKEKLEFKAVDNLSFDVNNGEILGILGPNGAGKTTLLRIIAGIMNPTSGEITIDDLNYKENETEIKKMLAFLSGNTKIYDTRRIKRNGRSTNYLIQYLSLISKTRTRYCKRSRRTSQIYELG